MFIVHFYRFRFKNGWSIARAQYNNDIIAIYYKIVVSKR